MNIELLKKLAFVADIMTSFGLGKQAHKISDYSEILELSPEILDEISSEISLFHDTGIDIFTPTLKSTSLEYACKVLGIKYKYLPRYYDPDPYYGGYIYEDDLETDTQADFMCFNAYKDKEYLMLLYFYVYFLDFIYGHNLEVIIYYIDNEGTQSMKDEVNFVFISPRSYYSREANKIPRPYARIYTSGKKILSLNIKEMDWEKMKEVFKDEYQEYPAEENNSHLVHKKNSNNSESYGKYEGTYVQDVAGYSDNVIDDAFDGDSDAYWNID
jgi:hypothetical protein